ncbi:Helix-turn-helix domain protein [Arsenophonus nasoniae]|uniref:Helix-turn-helix domain protein n=1 Tax=Arsenophonus nasoniae TaxID=638 RepID=A0A4V1BXB2_9GAMM|nr:Helix-turn-helix domain protein [Arsenophonus nasoniae]
MYRATKVRIYPTQEQAELLEKQFGVVRFVYNKALHIRTHWYKRYGVSLSNIKHIQPLLPIAKKSRRYGWIKQADSNALQVALQNLDQAFKNFFDKRAKYPKFKRKHGAQSSYHCSNLKITNDTIKIPKIPAIRANIHREITGKVKSITLSRSATGKYYASLLCDDGVEVPAKPVLISNITGLDVVLSVNDHRKLIHFLSKSDQSKLIHCFTQLLLLSAAYLSIGSFHRLIAVHANDEVNDQA